MNVEGDEGEPLFVQLPPQLVDLTAMGEQLSRSQWVVIEVSARVAMGGDMHVVKLQFSLANQTKTIAEIRFAITDGFHLGAHQLDSRFKGFENFVLMPRLAVVGHEAVCSGPCCSSGCFFYSSFCHGLACIYRGYPGLGSLALWRLSLPALVASPPVAKQRWWIRSQLQKNR